MLLTLLIGCNWIPSGALDLDEDGVLDTVDCDRDDPTAGELQTWFRDADEDGFGLPDVTEVICGDPGPGWVLAVPIQDCDDTDPLGSVAQPFFRDHDGDGFGSSTDLVLGCGQPEGASIQGGDCDDGNNAISPGAAEICNGGIDDDCDGLADDLDDVFDAPPWYEDLDGDGVPSAVSTKACIQPAGLLPEPAEFDCDDNDAVRTPGAPEICANGIDEDCSGLVDDGPGGPTWFIDVDQDTWTPGGTGEVDCAIRTGWTQRDPSQGIDCDDGNADAFPGGTERFYDGVDGDCSGDDDYDVDGDGYVPAVLPPDSVAYTGPLPQTDCNDNDAALSPAAEEVCDPARIDENCDGIINDAGIGGTELAIDLDRDGARGAETSLRCDAAEPGWVDLSADPDCDDEDGGVNPSALEVPGDGIDQDCNGADTAVCFADVDLDGFGDPDAPMNQADGACGLGESAIPTDCDDARADVFPGQTEWCDDVDHDCDGTIDPGTPTATEWTSGVPADITATVALDGPYVVSGDALRLCGGPWPARFEVGPGQVLETPAGLPPSELVAPGNVTLLTTNGSEVTNLRLLPESGNAYTAILTDTTAREVFIDGPMQRNFGILAIDLQLEDSTIIGTGSPGVTAITATTGDVRLRSSEVRDVTYAVNIVEGVGAGNFDLLEITDSTIGGTANPITSFNMTGGTAIEVSNTTFDQNNNVFLSCAGSCLGSFIDTTFIDTGILGTGMFLSLENVTMDGSFGIIADDGQVFGENVSMINTNGALDVGSSLVVFDGLDIVAPAGGPVLWFQDVGGFLNDLDIQDAVLVDAELMRLQSSEVDVTGGMVQNVSTGAVAPFELNASSKLSWFTGAIDSMTSDTAGVVHAIDSQASFMDTVITDVVGADVDVAWLEASVLEHEMPNVTFDTFGGSSAADIRIDAMSALRGRYYDSQADIDVVFSDGSPETVPALGTASSVGSVWVVNCQDLPTCTVTMSGGCATVRSAPFGAMVLGGLFVVGRIRRRSRVRTGGE